MVITKDVLEFEVVEIRRKTVIFERNAESNALQNIAAYKKELTDLYDSGKFILEKADVATHEILFKGRNRVE